MVAMKDHVEELRALVEHLEDEGHVVAGRLRDVYLAIRGEDPTVPASPEVKP
jgi:hypothetical protein